jgi:hypothetical protein
MPIYDLDKILHELTVNQYDSLADNKRFYEISAEDNRAYPVYGDIVSGIYTRYFTCRSNLVKHGPVYEIDAGQYKGLSGNANFVSVEIPWRIRGKIDDTSLWISGMEVKNPGVVSQNKALIEDAAQRIPAIVYYMLSNDPVITKKRLLEYYQGDFKTEE